MQQASNVVYRDIDASQALTKRVQADAQVGRVATAIVIDAEEGKDLSQTIFTRIYSNTTDAFQFFDNEDAAKGWLSNTIMTTHPLLDM